MNGILYGTAGEGGPSNAGVVFSINPNGNFKVIRAFQGGSSDGSGPVGGLIDVGGTFYGTTEFGGADNDGTVYSITPGGVEHVLHSFSGSNGSVPEATLIEVNGMLYGTTSQGGANSLGTLFRVSTAGNAKVLHNFGGTGDGADPLYGALVNVNGTLYGTTNAGGATGVGTIFKSSLIGKEKVLYSFDGTPANGCAPYNGLIEFKGTLYGTSVGRSSSLCTSNGTIFSIQPSGGETTIHTFSGGKGGYDRSDWRRWEEALRHGAPWSAPPRPGTLRLDNAVTVSQDPQRPEDARGAPWERPRSSLPARRVRGSRNLRCTALLGVLPWQFWIARLSMSGKAKGLC